MSDTRENTDPYDVLPRGERVKRLLAEKGWTPEDLRKHMGWPSADVDNLVNGRKAIDAFSALRLEEAFGVSAETWMELETAHELSMARRFQPGGRPAWTLVLGAFVEDRNDLHEKDPALRLSSFLHRVFPYAFHYRSTMAQLIIDTDAALNSDNPEMAEWKKKVGLRTVREFNAVAALLRTLSK